MRKLLLLTLMFVTFGAVAGCAVYVPGVRYGYYRHHHRYWR
jgi:hypothetical protein